MNWITRLFEEINELIAVMATKLNTLNTKKEDKSNKKVDLTSTNAEHYPNVPAVNTGLANTLQSAQTYTDTKIQAASGNYILVSQKGANGGVAELDASGKVPATQLPSYVDDVIDLAAIVTTNPSSGMTAGQKRYNSTSKKIFTSTSATAGTVSDPEADKIYVVLTDNTTWRWSGTALVQLNSGLALGETSSTAYRGDRGKVAYDHSQETGNPHGTTIAQIPNLQSTLDAKAETSHTHNAASTTVGGFVKLGSDTVQTVAVNTPTAVANRTYPVQFDSSGKAVVNVGWTDNNTTYTTDTLVILNAGTSTAGALQSAKNLTDWGDARYTKASELGDPTVGIPDWSTALQSQTTAI